MANGNKGITPISSYSITDSIAIQESLIEMYEITEEKFVSLTCESQFPNCQRVIRKKTQYHQFPTTKVQYQIKFIVLSFTSR